MGPSSITGGCSIAMFDHRSFALFHPFMSGNAPLKTKENDLHMVDLLVGGPTPLVN